MITSPNIFVDDGRLQIDSCSFPLPRIPLFFGQRAGSGGVHPGRTLLRQRHHQTRRMYFPREAGLPVMHLSCPRDTCICMLQDFMYIFL